MGGVDADRDPRPSGRPKEPGRSGADVLARENGLACNGCARCRCMVEELRRTSASRSSVPLTARKEVPSGS